MSRKSLLRASSPSGFSSSSSFFNLLSTSSQSLLLPEYTFFEAGWSASAGTELSAVADTSASPVPSSASHLPAVCFFSLISTLAVPTVNVLSAGFILWKSVKQWTYSAPPSSLMVTSTSVSLKLTLTRSSGNLRAKIDSTTSVAVWYQSCRILVGSDVGWDIAAAGGGAAGLAAGFGGMAEGAGMGEASRASSASHLRIQRRSSRLPSPASARALVKAACAASNSPSANDPCPLRMRAFGVACIFTERVASETASVNRFRRRCAAARLENASALLGSAAMAWL
mmetsp:Transcript_24050/g.61424  ORF Transcript_24050/g.61424 Transcript_24050/m.61424 type:complete len:283 (+) Transcript_24050:499-1347(+)